MVPACGGGVGSGAGVWWWQGLLEAARPKAPTPKPREARASPTGGAAAGTKPGLSSPLNLKTDVRRSHQEKHLQQSPPLLGVPQETRSEKVTDDKDMDLPTRGLKN